MQVYLRVYHYIQQNWKTRWFVLQKTTLRYYRQRADAQPIRDIDLRDCTECTIDFSLGQENCFRSVAFNFFKFTD